MSPELTQKLGLTKRLISSWIPSFKSPALMSSFGKDSQVMLHICRKLGIDLPVIYHRHPFFPEKNRFADNQIYSLGLKVFDWNPTACGVKVKDDVFEVSSAYQIGANKHMNLALNILSPETDKKFICGRHDMLERPKGSCNHPWDMLIIGHKSSDVDQFEGEVKLKTHTHKIEDGPTLAFPLKDWTNDDVWDYVEEFRVPVQLNRYDVKNRREWPNKDYNNDYVRACKNCIDKRNPARVHCPLLAREVDNIGDQLQDFGAARYAYIQ